MKKVVVVGLGSMGRRRIRLMRNLQEPVQIVGVDFSPLRRANAEAEFELTTFESLNQAMCAFAPEFAFVCTSPLSHGDVVIDCLSCGLHVFTEINLVGDWYEQATSMAKAKSLCLFISSTFLYRKEVEYIAKEVNGSPVNYIYHSGQYLPDWHPWESYKSYFVSDKRTNACREIFAIELPWITHVFGEIESLSVMRSKDSSLDIDFCDTYIISARHKTGSKGVFCQDIVSRKGVRRLEVFSENKHIFWDGTPDSLRTYDISRKRLDHVVLYDCSVRDPRYGETIIEDAYLSEIVEFFLYVENKCRPRHTFTADRKILDMIDAIEEGRYD